MLFDATCFKGYMNLVPNVVNFLHKKKIVQLIRHHHRSLDVSVKVVVDVLDCAFYVTNQSKVFMFGAPVVVSERNASTCFPFSISRLTLFCFPYINFLPYRPWRSSRTCTAVVWRWREQYEPWYGCVKRKYRAIAYNVSNRLWTFVQYEARSERISTYGIISHVSLIQFVVQRSSDIRVLTEQLEAVLKYLAIAL
jgi:hypothetical protein